MGSAASPMILAFFVALWGCALDAQQTHMEMEPWLLGEPCSLTESFFDIPRPIGKKGLLIFPALTVALELRGIYSRTQACGDFILPSFFFFLFNLKSVANPVDSSVLLETALMH